MKKFFTLICALVGLVATGNAATVDDVEVCKHSYVLVADDWNGAGTVKLTQGTLYGDNFFMVASPQGQDKSNGKKSFDLAAKDDEGNYKYFNGKYAEYGEHLNSLRIKNTQDVLVMKVTAKSKVIVCFNGQGKAGTAARYPKFAKDVDLKEALNDAPTAETPAVGIEYREFVAPDDMTLYIGSYNGDTYISYIIVEANEAPGTPSVKVGNQMYENGLYFREVTVKPAQVSEEGSEELFPTVVTYTTDGSTPTADSEIVPNDPIKVYQNCTLKFQAFGDFMGDGKPNAEFICDGADNDGIVSFSFDAPTITDDGKGNITVESKYDGAKNYVACDGVEPMETSNYNVSSSTTITAYSQIQNGNYATFTSKSSSKDVYVLTPITEKKEIKVTAGKAVVDEVATAASTDGSTIYMVEGGAVSADPMDFFIKNIAFGVVNGDNAQYQVPEGQEVYLQMNGDIAIVFELAEKSAVTITGPKNSCKNFESDPKFAVVVDGTTKNTENVAANYDLLNPETQEVVENLPGNIMKFDLEAGIHKFTRYTGTGTIKISSIVIEPGKSVYGASTGINDIEAASAAKVVKTLQNGQIVIKKGNAEYNAVGAQLK